MSHLAETLRPFEEAARNLQGWRFEYLPEVIEGDVPWNYERLASDLLRDGDSVLDLGTGGGESFLEILGSRHCDAYATEEWGPNVPVAAQRLKDLAPVARCASTQLPFRDDRFDLVLSRHEAIDPAEVSRVLNPGGCFLSQQVINNFMFELGDYFPGTATFPDFFNDYQNEFLALGMTVRRAEEFRYKIRFNTLGHLVYQIVAAPWTLPGFSVDTHIEGLTVLDEQQKNGRDLLFSAGYYLLEVQ